MSEQEVQWGFEAIEHHGYSTLLPAMPEWLVVRANWSQLRPEIAAIDLDLYHPFQPLRVYAPKNRATVRVVSLLHPIDLIIYTALTLIVIADIEANRVPLRRRIVFSYRAESRAPNRLYGTANNFSMFRERLDERSSREAIRYVAIADIADFYPRIYQHRLENVIESSSQSARTRDVARVLVKKLISNLSGKNSYGIPVGPYASRVLAEAVLIDVDSYLISEGLDFIRWVDDYYFFTRTEQQAQEILISLAQRLYDRQGLTLSALKTKIQTKDIFRRRFVPDPNRDVDARLQRVSEFSSRFDPYSEEEIELSEAERAEFVELDIIQLVAEALEDRELIDYDTLSTLLRHPKLLSVLPLDARRNLGDVLLRNKEHLYPIAGPVSEYFSTFADLPLRDRKRVQTQLLASLKPKRGKWPPDYYMMWVLSIFSSGNAWHDSTDFTRILRDHRSEIVRRMATLAISNNGTRAAAIEARDQYSTSSPLERIAILLATRKLGRDERDHWKQSLQLTGVLERKI
ncbi:MAG TPA: RNA-directed DNA polymerase [Terriglobia bacterium]|nr:RNA-directed DNA polymerase [Terriglobia bacterium]